MVMHDKLKLMREPNSVFKEIDLETLNEDQLIFSFGEFEKIGIVLESDKYDVEIEASEYFLDNNYYSNDDNMIKLIPNNLYYISGNYNDINIGYVPCKYRIVITKGNVSTYCIFEVLCNRNLSKDGYYNMINNIEQFMSGLSKDFFKQRPLNNINHIETINSQFELIEYFDINKDKIVYHALNILKNFKETIVKSYKLEPYIQRQDSTSIRKNFKVVDQSKSYNVHKTKTSEQQINQILKFYLLKIRPIITECIQYLSIIKLDNNLDIKTIKQKKDEIKELKDINESISIDKSVNSQNKTLNKQFEDSKESINKIDKWLTSLTKINRSLNLLLMNENIRNAPASLFNSDIIQFKRNNDYYYFEMLFNNISKLDNLKTFNYKKSFQLFEIYGFILIQNIFKELNYKFIDNKVKDCLAFKANSNWKMVNNNGDYVNIKYDYFCENYYTTKRGVVNINSHHCNPDYIITFHNDNKEIKGMIVIDMKYRYLTSMIPETNKIHKIDEIVTDYYQLAYYNEINNSLYRNNKVLIIYPSLEENNFNRHFGDYLGINVCTDFDKSNTYQKLKYIISEYL
ncbi:MAG: hypothetical protein WBO70_02390 [Erysipelotrichaceae bacterium]